jgi:outer membrane protein assembly factor BamD (BamD/ComL family)
MNLLMRSLPFVCLFCIGCGGSPPVATESEAQGASRVFALAQDLENSQKTKKAMDAYRQVVRYFPNTPEARKAAQRISKAQRDAMQKASARNGR